MTDDKGVEVDEYQGLKYTGAGGRRIVKKRSDDPEDDPDDRDDSDE